MRKCRYCGMPMEDDDLFCTRCGKPVEKSTVEESEKEEELYEEEQPVKSGRKWIIGAAAAAVVLLVFFIGIFQAFSGGKKGKSETDMQTASEQIESGKEQVSGETGQELTADTQQSIVQADENTAASQNDKDAEEVSGAQEPQAEKTAPDDADLQDKVSENSKITGVQENSQDQEKKDGQAMLNENSAGSASDDTYILPGSDSRYYSWQEVDALDSDTLQMAINELYARHGRRFDTEYIRSYFEKKSWYHPSVDPSAIDGKEDAYFNDYEKANYQLLIQVRGARTAPAPVQDNKVNQEEEAMTGYVGD